MSDPASEHMPEPASGEQRAPSTEPASGEQRAPSPEPPSGEQRAPSPEEVREALMMVVDPEIGLPIVELGLVYDIAVDADGDVQVTYTLTSMGCPVGPMIDGQINEILGMLPGVKSHKTTIVFQPPWTPEKMSDEAKAALGYL